MKLSRDNIEEKKTTGIKIILVVIFGILICACVLGKCKKKFIKISTL